MRGRLSASARRVFDEELVAQSVGTDIVEVARFERAAEAGADVRDDLFSKRELAECRSRRHENARLAACFAVKEAALKAAGIGLTEGTRFREIEVVNQASGAPQVRLHGRMRELVGDASQVRWLVASAFTDRLACAVVILRRKGTSSQ